MIYKRYFVFIFFLLIYSFSNSSRALDQDESVPKLELLVSFDRQLLRSNQSIKATIWTANNSDKQLVTTQVDIVSPPFLEWHDQSCDGSLIRLPLQLGSLSPRTSHFKTLCASLNKNDFEIGDLNLLFILTYAWQTEQGLQRSDVTVEKAIKVDMFGTDNVLGIPLAFASFVLPGLFCLITMRQVFKVPFTQTLEKDDKVIFCVMISAMIIFFANLARMKFQWQILEYFNLDSQIGQKKLFYLIILGVVIGITWGLIDRYRRQRKESKLQQYQIELKDNYLTLINKLLSINCYVPR